MDISPEINRKIQDLQVYEQNLQSLLMQRQAVQVEFNEIHNALSELQKSGEEVYKMLGGIMIRSDKKVLIKDLEEKKKVAEIRIQSLEKQEKSIEEKAESLRSEVQKSLAPKK